MRDAIATLLVAAALMAACGGAGPEPGRDSPGPTHEAPSPAATATPTLTATPTQEPAPAPPLEPTGIPAGLWAPPAPTEAPEVVAQALPPLPEPGAICPGVIPAVTRWADLISRYGWNLCEALRIIDCESDGDPWVMNAAGSGACGLWQHLPCEGLGDPELSTAIAWDKYSRRGWQPWTVGGCFP